MGKNPIIIASLLLAAAHAAAIDLPKRKPGLWEMTLSAPDGKRPPRSAKYCIDAATEALMDNLAGGMTRHDCIKNDVLPQGASVVVDSVCMIDKSKVTGRSIITAEGDTIFHMQVHTHFDPPLWGQADVDSTSDSKWLGACPADMRPGDMMTTSGIKVNIKDIVKAGP